LIETNKKQTILCVWLFVFQDVTCASMREEWRERIEHNSIKEKQTKRHEQRASASNEQEQVFSKRQTCKTRTCQNTTYANAASVNQFLEIHSTKLAEKGREHVPSTQLQCQAFGVVNAHHTHKAMCMDITADSL
jgi:hypothetical protein